MTLTWVLLALAAGVWPSGRVARSAGAAPREAAAARRAGARRAGAARPTGAVRGAATSESRRERILLVVALGGLAAGSVAVGGPVQGGLMALFGCPPAAMVLRAVQRRPAPARAERSLALTLDLAAAVLRAGRPLADALTLAAPAADDATGRALHRVAGLLRLGAEPGQAWAVLARDGPLAPVAVAALRSATSGVRLADSFERLAADVRIEATVLAAARAHRAGITAMAPLGACFLPAFVCLGVVPVVVGIAGSAFGVLP